MIVTPHFDDHGVGSDPEGLCDDLAAAYAGWLGGAKHVSCKFYVATGPKPHYPVAESVVNPTSQQVSSCPREVALCLSFYSERNVPRYRGRLYMPMGAAGETTPAVRPSGQQMARVGEFATVLQDLGGVDVDWVVYSRTDTQARPVTNWWVDNEWDTVRARGLRSDTRILGATSEAQGAVAWPVYSERLLSTPGHIGWVFLEVPAGRRAVVKQIAAVNYGAADVYCQVAIGGAAIWGRSVPGPLDHVQQAGMWVAYQGEELGIYCAAAGVGIGLHGFMFSAAGDSWWTAASEGSAGMAIAGPPIEVEE